MNKIKQTLTLLTIIILTLMSRSLFGQAENRELGIRLAGFQDFDFIYKKGREENKLTRYRLGFANLDFQNAINNQNFNLSLGFAIGAEERRSIAENLQFIHGLEPTLSLALSTTDDIFNLRIRPGIGYVLGFQYNVSDKFYVNIETIPSLSTSFIIDNNGFNDMYSINAGFNSNAIALSLVYQFKKKEE